MSAREKEVIRAAHILKRYCAEHPCHMCTLNSIELCGIPAGWVLPELEEAEPPTEPTERKLVGIKTIEEIITSCDLFDKRVNEAIAEGWTLVKRDVLCDQTNHKYTTLIAELERYNHD